ncbi:hypothetical protein F511_01655 [Dorcoceras hygrometricum]|uniref:Uncharacterized protein n=1 Tax=Dorcoceras hygrometricum TaxID=472368 RepID=A0A2Z7BWU4_9LAMI|nr:hypothetical protein F511_01655 [Dorcoceras hygrometricum]
MTVLPLNIGKSCFDLLGSRTLKILLSTSCVTRLIGTPLEESSTCVTFNGSGIQLAVGPQPLWLRNHNFGLAHRIMVKRLATSPHDPLDSIGYPRMSSSGESSTTMHRLLHASGSHPIPPPDDPNIGYPRMSSSGESSTTMHRLLHASGSHPIPPPDDPKVVRTNQYNQDLGLIHSTNGNHLESPKEGSSIDDQVTIYLHAQNITMFPTNETWYFASSRTRAALSSF